MRPCGPRPPEPDARPDGSSAPRVVRVGDLQCLVQDRDTFSDLFGGRGARRRDMGPVEVDERPQAAVFAGGSELGHRFGIRTTGVEWNQRLTGVAVSYTHLT